MNEATREEAGIDQKPRAKFLSRHDQATRILDAVSQATGVTVPGLLSRERTRTIAEARHLAAWLLRNRTRLSFLEIGAVLGGRDHTTIMAAVRAHARRSASDTYLAQAEAAVVELLGD